MRATMTQVILVGTWVILTLIIGLLWLQRGKDVATARILIHVTDELQNLNLHFGLLHVRDGKDEIPGAGDPRNEEIKFRQVDRHGNMEVTVSYARALGFQFKCFVDQGNYGYEKIEQMLKDSQFTDVSKGQGKKFRIWFILKDYPTYQTIDGFTNNFYYPS
jgi:hypothetical protein